MKSHTCLFTSNEHWKQIRILALGNGLATPRTEEQARAPAPNREKGQGAKLALWERLGASLSENLVHGPSILAALCGDAARKLPAGPPRYRGNPAQSRPPCDKAVLGTGDERPPAGCWTPAPRLLATTWQPGPARAADGLGSHPRRPRAVGQHFYSLCVSDGGCPVSSPRAPGRAGVGGGCRALLTSERPDSPGPSSVPGPPTGRHPGMLSSQNGPWPLLLLRFCLGCRTQLSQGQGVPPFAGGMGPSWGPKPLRAALCPPGLTPLVDLGNKAMEFWRNLAPPRKVPRSPSSRGFRETQIEATGRPSVHRDGQNQTAKNTGWRGGGEAKPRAVLGGHAAGVARRNHQTRGTT